MQIRADIKQIQTDDEWQDTFGPTANIVLRAGQMSRILMNILEDTVGDC